MRRWGEIGRLWRFWVGGFGVWGTEGWGGGWKAGFGGGGYLVVDLID